SFVIVHFSRNALRNVLGHRPTSLHQHLATVWRDLELDRGICPQVNQAKRAKIDRRVAVTKSGYRAAVRDGATSLRWNAIDRDFTRQADCADGRLGSGARIASSRHATGAGEFDTRVQEQHHECADY